MIFGDFVAIFEKKTWLKKIFFSKFFFQKFWETPFLSIIRRDLKKKKFKNFENFFLKISHLEKNGIFDKNFEFWLVLLSLTVCLKSCHHDYVRNFYVKCTPFAHQRIGKVQSVVRYPVCFYRCKETTCSPCKCFKGIPRNLFRSRKKTKFKLFLISMAYWATANWMCQRFSHTAPNPLKNPTFYLVEAGFQVGFLKKEPLLLNKKWDF